MTSFSKEDYEILDKLLLKAPSDFLKKSMEKESIFHMHIPKTGGSFVNKIFSQYNMGNPQVHGRCNSKIPLYPDPTDSIPSDLIYTDMKGFKNNLNFCVIRNPFDWLTSYYFHQHGVPEVPWSGVSGVGGIRYYYKTFESFVEAYCNKEKYWNSGLNEFREFYPFQIFDETGVCQADFIMKNGNKLELNEACILLAAAFGIPPTEMQEVTKNRVNKSEAKEKTYQDYYTPKLRSMLEKKWESILHVLGYNFYGSTDEKIMISGNNLVRVENSLRELP